MAKKTKEEKQAKVLAIVKAIAVIVVGVLLCLTIINLDTVLNVIFGAALAIFGLAIILIFGFQKKTLLHIRSLYGAFIAAIGIYLIIDKIQYNRIIAYVLVIGGAIFLIDFLFELFSKKRVAFFVTEAIVGAISLTLGILILVFPQQMSQFAGIILGILVFIFGVILLIEAITEKNIILTWRDSKPVVKAKKETSTKGEKVETKKEEKKETAKVENKKEEKPAEKKVEQKKTTEVKNK